MKYALEQTRFDPSAQSTMGDLLCEYWFTAQVFWAVI